MNRDKLSLATAIAATALAALLMGGSFVAGERSARPLASLPAPTAAAGQGHPSQAGQINVNIAGVEELSTLPGVGQARAEAIIADREANGPFLHPEDLLRVKGIGEKTLEGFLDQITVGGE